MNLFILPTDTCFWIATPLNDIEWYKKIYEIKNRDFDKPIAILVMDFDWLQENTILTNKQIEFLKNYERPFTILTKTKKNLISDNIPNKNIYKKVAFRVAHTFMHRSLIGDFWPLFLTSANPAWEGEVFSTAEIKYIFKDEIEKYNIKVFAHPWYCINSKFNSSDIFEFIWDSLDLNYIRKS